MNNPTAGITAVILASGFSKRMGCNKLLLPVEGKAMIAHVFDAVRQVEFEQTVVVTGFDSIAQLAVGNGFQAVDNDSPEIGQSHSVVLGVQKTSQSAGWMFFNGDMPWLKSDTIGKLLEYADTYCQSSREQRFYFRPSPGFDRRPWRTDASRVSGSICPIDVSDPGRGC